MREERDYAIGEAVNAARRALGGIRHGEPEEAVALAHLSNTLRMRFEALGNLADIREATELGRRAELEARDPGQRVAIANNLCLCLRLLGQAMDDLDVISEAVAAGMRALEIALDRSGTERGAILSNLADAHHARYARLGEPADLDMAIVGGREALGSVEPESPQRLSIMSNLSAALQTRAERSGSSADIDEAVAVGQAAADATAPGHPDRPARLTNLNTAHLIRFDLTDDIQDVNAAIDAGQRSVDGTAVGDPARAGRLSNLGVALRSRFERFRSPDDLDRAVACGRSAVDAVEVGHPARSGYLSNLGSALRARFQLSHDPAEAEAAVKVLQEAADTISLDHPDRAMVLSNLGAMLFEWFEVSAIRSLPVRAIDAFRSVSAVVTARPRVRVATCTSWGRIAADLADWPSALEGLALAVGLFGQLAPRDLDREDQERELARHGALASDAAACAIQLGAPERALALLEQGRGVLLGQAIDARADLTRLGDRDPVLAEQFDSLRRQLDGAWPSTAAPAAQRRRQLAHDLNGTVTAIRALSGFADFLYPPPLGDLVRLAEPGPIVVVNISEIRSDALVVTGSGVTSVPLPDASPDRVREQVVAALFGLTGETGGESGEGKPPEAGADQVITALLSWVWQAIAAPVLRALDLPATGPRTRLWWVPTGLATFLPLHAAQSTDRVQCVLDHVVSSYTPTMRALAFSRESTVGQSPRLLAVSSSAGSSPLPAADREVAGLSGWLGVPVTVISGERATRTAVLRDLPSHSWAHFSCHADSHAANPSRSRLAIRDPDGPWLDVADISRLRLADAELAFLSACETTRTVAALSDEAIHVTSAFQLAGFRHVVGTLWPVRDRLAMRVASAFYRQLAAPCGPSADTAAAVLRQTAVDLRRTLPDHPTAWAAHIHVGP